MMNHTHWMGYLRKDGRKGIRNYIVVVYLVESAHHVARDIVYHFRGQPVQLMGFAGSHPIVYADRIMNALCTHPNVGGVLLVSLGSENDKSKELEDTIRESGRVVHSIIIQNVGGTRQSIREGLKWVHLNIEILSKVPTVPMTISDLMVGTVSGDGDTITGLTANPAVGHAINQIVTAHGIAVFEETGDIIGLDEIISSRAVSRELAVELKKSLQKVARYYNSIKNEGFTSGNARSGLTTIEEKSMGAYCKSGDTMISGLIKPGDKISKPGLYLLDTVPNIDPQFGFPMINDTAEFIEMIATGCHLILLTTGGESVVGSAISPLIKICASPRTYRRMQEDMDINAGTILSGISNIDDVGDDIFSRILAVARGLPTCAERLGYQESILTYNFRYN